MNDKPAGNPTPDALRALAQVVVAVRPGWDLPGVLVHLTNATRDHDLADVAIAAVRAAADPQAHTPAVIARPGNHWRGGIDPTPAPEPLVRYTDQPHTTPERTAAGAALARAALTTALAKHRDVSCPDCDWQPNGQDRRTPQRQHHAHRQQHAA